MIIQQKTAKTKMLIKFDGSYTVERQDEWVYEGNITEVTVLIRSDQFELSKMVDELIKIFPITKISLVRATIHNNMSKMLLNDTTNCKVGNVRVNNMGDYTVEKIIGDTKSSVTIGSTKFNYLEGNFRILSTPAPSTHIKVNCTDLTVDARYYTSIKIIDTKTIQLYIEVNIDDAVINCVNTAVTGTTSIHSSSKNPSYIETNCSTKELKLTILSAKLSTINLDSKADTALSLYTYGSKKVIISSKTPYGFVSMHTDIKDEVEVTYDGNCMHIPKDLNKSITMIPTEPTAIGKNVSELTDEEFIKFINNKLKFGYNFDVFYFARVLELLGKKKADTVCNHLDIYNDAAGKSNDELEQYVLDLKSYIEKNNLQYIIEHNNQEFAFLSNELRKRLIFTKEITDFFIDNKIDVYNVFMFEERDFNNMPVMVLNSIIEIYDSGDPTKYYKVKYITSVEQLNLIMDELSVRKDNLRKIVDIFKVQTDTAYEYAKQCGLSGISFMIGDKKICVDHVNDLYNNAKSFIINNTSDKEFESMWEQLTEYGIGVKIILITLAYNNRSSLFHIMLNKFLNEKMYLTDDFENYTYKGQLLNNIQSHPDVERYLNSQENDYAWVALGVDKPEKIHKYSSTLVNLMLNLEIKKINKNILFRKQSRQIDTIYLDTINEVKAPYNKQSKEYQSLKYAEEQAKQGYITDALLDEVDQYISINVDEKIKYKNKVISEFISNHNKILQNIIDGTKAKIPKQYTTNKYKFNLVYLELIPKKSTDEEWVFTKQYMNDKKINSIPFDELTELYNDAVISRPKELSEIVFPVLTKLSNMVVEEKRISIDNQSLQKVQQIYRLNLAHLDKLTLLCSGNIVDRIKEYIRNGNHPTSRAYLTVGWTRFNVDVDSKSIWINEIQNDIRKVLAIEEEAASNSLTDKIMYNILFSFQQWVRKHYADYTVVLPSYTTREKIIGGSPMPGGYDNPAKKLKFTKGEYSETPWNKIKKGNGLVWIWSPLNEVKSI